MKSELLSLSKAQFLDRRAIYKFGIARLVLMENAGRNVAEFILSSSPPSERIVILAGYGYNGGDGLVSARHLFLEGRKVSVFLFGNRYTAKDETIIQLRILKNMGLKVYMIAQQGELERAKVRIGKANFLVDALLGVGVKGKVRPLLHSLIEWVNSLRLKKVAVDIPSGLNPESGEAQGIALKADYTITFQGIKKGLLSREGRKYAGKVILTKIGG